MVELFSDEFHEYIKKMKEYDKKHPKEVKKRREEWWENDSKSFVISIEKQLEKEKNSK